MDASSFKKIKLTHKAGQILALITKGCLRSNISRKTYALLNTESVSLEQTLIEMPLTTGCLIRLSEKKGENPIDYLTIIELFGGQEHLRDAYDKMEDFEYTNNVDFRKKIVKIGIDLSSKINKTMFLVADLLLVGKIVTISQRQCGKVADIVACHDQILFKNVALPNDTDLKNNDPVLTHNGFVVCKIDSNLKPTVMEITLAQDKDKHFSDAVKFVSDNNRPIDFQNFCPDIKGVGFDLTSRQHKRINN